METRPAAECGFHAGEAGLPIRCGSSAALPQGSGAAGWPAGVRDHDQSLHPHREPGQTEGQVKLELLNH